MHCLAASLLPQALCADDSNPPASVSSCRPSAACVAWRCCYLLALTPPLPLCVHAVSRDARARRSRTRCRAVLLVEHAARGERRYERRRREVPPLLGAAGPYAGGVHHSAHGQVGVTEEAGPGALSPRRRPPHPPNYTFATCTKLFTLDVGLLKNASITSTSAPARRVAHLVTSATPASRRCAYVSSSTASCGISGTHHTLGAHGCLLVETEIVSNRRRVNSAC